MNTNLPADTPSETAVATGQIPTNAEIFYTTWGEELLKGSIKTLNDSHQRLTTLATALLGASVFASDRVGRGCYIVAVLCFVVTLLASLAGGFPYSMGTVCVSDPDAVREFTERGMKWKTRLLTAGAVTLSLGLSVAVAGVILH
jgi:hypothetical protein